MIELCTERLLIRDPLLSDLPGWHQLKSDTQNLRFVEHLQTHSLAESRTDLQRAVDAAHNPRRAKWFFTAELMQTREFIGTIGFMTEPIEKGLLGGIGWFLLPAHQGRGYATEAFRALILFMFAHGVTVIDAGCNAANGASERVMQKGGMRLVRREAERLTYQLGLAEYIEGELRRRGADLVGTGDLRELPLDVRGGLPVGICVAVKYPKEVIRGIAALPTPAYRDWYHQLNECLDMLVTWGAKTLQAFGYKAVAQTRTQVGTGEDMLNTALPHKTVATRAGIGWIGKSALLVTERYGSMVRISSILTDAPLKTVAPVNQSKCGDCTICTEACPAGAVSGRAWEAGLPREAIFDAVKCRSTARVRAMEGFGGRDTICGRCIAVCPYTRQHLDAPPS